MFIRKFGLSSAILLCAVSNRAADLSAPAATPTAKAVDAAGGANPATYGPSTASLEKSSSAAAKAAAAAKSIPSPTINVSVTEWVVFIADVSNPQLNARNLFPDNLPPLVDDLRA
ncbi:MAG TPA: hypothetical protein VGH32_09340 [Pirellulales bacterium]